MFDMHYFSVYNDWSTGRNSMPALIRLLAIMSFTKCSRTSQNTFQNHFWWNDNINQYFYNILLLFGLIATFILICKITLDCQWFTKQICPRNKSSHLFEMLKIEPNFGNDTLEYFTKWKMQIHQIKKCKFGSIRENAIEIFSFVLFVLEIFSFLL